MKKLFASLCLVLFSTFLFAQDPTVTISQKVKVPRGTTIQNACRVGDKIFVIESMGMGSSTKNLAVYDAESMKLLSKRIFQQGSCKDDPNCIDSDFGYRRTLFFKNSMIMIFQSYNRTDDENTLFAQKLDNEGNFVGKLIVIDKIPAKKRNNAGEFIIEVSEDSTKFLIIADAPTKDKNAKEKLKFRVFNPQLENLSNSELETGKKDNNSEVMDRFLGNDGKIYVLIRTDLEKKERKRGQSASYYSIFTVDPSDQSVAEYQVVLPKKNVEDLAIKIDNDRNKVICTGFYSDLKSSEYTGKDIDGFFYMRVNIKTSEVEVSGFKPIDKKMVLELKEKRKLKEGEGISKTFDIVKIFNHLDGTVTLLAENRYLIITRTTTTNSNGFTTTTTTYHYYRKNIFVIKIDRDGSVLAFIDIPKYQYTVDDGGMYSSFLAMENDDRLVLLYNDNRENLDPNVKTIKDCKKMPWLKKAVLTMVEVMPDGSYTKKILQDNTKTGTTFLPESGFRIANGTYIIPVLDNPGAVSCACTMLFTKPGMGLAKIQY
jgi:hypothetical protein